MIYFQVAAASKSSKAKPKPPSKRSTKETGFIYTLKDYQEQFKRTIAQTEKELTIISVDGEIKYLKNRSWLTFTILLDESEICKDLAEGIETIHSFLDEILKVTEETKAVIQGYNTNLSSLGKKIRFYRSSLFLFNKRQYGNPILFLLLPNGRATVIECQEVKSEKYKNCSIHVY